MGLQVKINSSNSDEQHVPGLGSLKPGQWTSVSEEQEERFKAAQGMTLKEAAKRKDSLFEVKDTKSAKEDE
jgi:hypothetical protein